MYQKNLPDIVPKDIVEKAVAEIFKSDSVIEKPIKVVYKYEEKFESNGDSSYWFFMAEVVGKTKDGKEYRGDNTRVIAFPYPYFNFLKAADYAAKNYTNAGVFITSFYQISEASYRSYDPYAKKW